MANKADTRTPEEKQAHQDLLQAGLGFHTISNIGDTSQIKQQAEVLSNYAISQRVDPEKDLNGLSRQVSLFGDIIPKEQESAKQNLLDLTNKNFNYALGMIGGEVAVGLAARLGTTKEEKALEKALSEPNVKLEDVKKAFSDMYEPSSLIQHYIALNNNSQEVSNTAYGALERSGQRRQLEFINISKDKKVTYMESKAKGYIAENIETADKEIADDVKIEIGSNLAFTQLSKAA